MGPNSKDVKKRLLIVEDEISIQDVLQTFFEWRGFVVDIACQLAEAQALLASCDYHVMIADISLSKDRDQEGLKLVEWGRRRYPGMKILVMSGTKSPEVQKQAIQCGADAFLGKPMLLMEIARAVTGMLEPAQGSSTTTETDEDRCRRWRAASRGE